ncbi:unnamed protein product [Caenorhabditis bovis]|uniref:Zinc finger C3HC4 RING-type domain-containing protein n=1 Tax=Caenorhabditis bovis TaxID=2654633 RepID=A0A8S1F6B7_9PELO|nr:unnamed protein product [Caenorhabditis bovis]
MPSIFFLSSTDPRVRIPKVLECGHSFCVGCLNHIFDSLKYSYVGNGEVFHQLNCPTCKKTMAVTNGISSISNNLQLIETMLISDNRIVKCRECEIDGNEMTIKICVDCTKQKHNFDMADMDAEKAGSVVVEEFAVCSTCILCNHKDHIWIEFYPIKLFSQHCQNLLSVAKFKADFEENVSAVKSILAESPRLIITTEKKLEELVDLMKRSRSSLHQSNAMNAYRSEMKELIGSLAKLRTCMNAFNENCAKNLDIIKDQNEAIEATCTDEFESISEMIEKKKSADLLTPTNIMNRFVKNFAEILRLSAYSVVDTVKTVKNGKKQ